MPVMTCDIIMVVWNNRDLTEQCVNSIFSSEITCQYRLILVDNASGQAAREYLDRLKVLFSDKIIIIRNKENLGYPKAVNQGIKSSSADYVCVINNDTLVFDGWLDEMMRVAESSKDVGIVNPANNFGKKRPWNKTYEQHAREMTAGRQGQYAETASPAGFCYLIKREVIDKIGLWDEQFSPGYFEDTEYALRAKQAGYKSVFAKGAFVFHLEHASFKKRGFNAFFKQSEEKFYKLYKRPQRILYVLAKTGNMYYNKIKDESYKLAENSNWVCIFLKKSAPEIDLREHTYIRAFRFSDLFFSFKTIFKILFKKKKFSRILVDDECLAARLINFKKYHKAEVGLL